MFITMEIILGLFYVFMICECEQIKSINENYAECKLYILTFRIYIYIYIYISNLYEQYTIGYCILI